MRLSEARQILGGDFSTIDLGEKSASQLFDEAFKMAIESLEEMDKLNKLMEALAETNFICDLHEHNNPWCDWNCENDKPDKIDCIERWLDWSDEE